MPEAWSGCAEPLADQRSKGRYPLALELQYKLLRGSRIERVGSGRTLNISSGGVLFKADDPLPARGSVELAMQWPFLLQGACGLKLVMRGRIVRCDANTRATAVRTEYYEFRTAGMRFTNMAATAVVNRKD
jgi:hypothetical protein